jgi:hypothetical protein
MHTFAPLFPLLVGAFVHLTALRSQPVLPPLLLDMDQGPLPLAIGKVLKAGKRQ